MTELSESQSEGKKKKFSPALIIGGLLALGYLFFSISNSPEFVSQLTHVKQNFSLEQSFAPRENSDAVNESELITSYLFEADRAGQTPLELISEDNDVEFDKYDFGVFVTDINGQQSNNEYYWAVYINGKYAQQSSDQIELQVGDLVEWRWEKIEMQD
ncbi:MAG: Uncharacterized protein XD95_0266 [Microgenomates bacterium 39_7]|nr:MAG: Uncharacterized protein XD95_0266 [Microgenomates bacterium 39_7]